MKPVWEEKKKLNNVSIDITKKRFVAAIKVWTALNIEHRY